jgi:hypothetical protein
VSEKRKKQIGWNTRAATDRLERDSAATCLVFAGLPKAKATIIPTNIKKIIDSPV